jgi:ribosomal protein S3AE
VHIVIIATVTALSILLFGGGTFSFEKYYKDYLKVVIEDKSRREQILDLAKDADQKHKQYRDEVTKVWADDIKSTFRNFDAKEDDFRRMVQKADQSRIAMQQSVLDVRFKVVGLMSKEEWNAMYDLIREKEAEEKTNKEKKDGG